MNSDPPMLRRPLDSVPFSHTISLISPSLYWKTHLLRSPLNSKKQRQAEAINGALAMIGLTAGLVVEGRTGKGILGQVLKAECIRNSVCSTYKFFFINTDNII